MWSWQWNTLPPRAADFMMCLFTSLACDNISPWQANTSCIVGYDHLLNIQALRGVPLLY
jgi:hypothetical protein